MRRDPAFAAQVEAAEVDGREEYRDLLEAQVQRRALRLEERSTKALEIALATELPAKYGWLRKAGSSDGDERGGLPMLKMELLTTAQIQELTRLQLLIEYGTGQRPNPELAEEIAERRQIEQPKHPDIDA